MELFILSFIFVGLAALGMAVGVLFRGSELKGTCATLEEGLYALTTCENCPARHRRGGHKPQVCSNHEIENRNAAPTAARTNKK